MTDTLIIRDMFKLSGGTTVIACDRHPTEGSWLNRKVRIISAAGVQRQELTISGQRSMLRQSNRLDQIAIETAEYVQLSTDEAQSGHWLIVL